MSVDPVNLKLIILPEFYIIRKLFCFDMKVLHLTKQSKYKKHDFLYMTGTIKRFPNVLNCLNVYPHLTTVGRAFLNTVKQLQHHIFFCILQNNYFLRNCKNPSKCCSIFKFKRISVCFIFVSYLFGYLFLDISIVFFLYHITDKKLRTQDDNC